jgi:hypothetical protein
MRVSVAVELAVVAVAVPAAVASSKASSPGPPADATRVETFKPNLDGDKGKERVYVYRRVVSGLSTSYFDVWDKRGAHNWKKAQRKKVATSPGSPESGLVAAWVGDLNRDGRVEIAVRDFLTPSAGESLSIFRQKQEDSLAFKHLQSIGGDRVTVQEESGKPDTIERLIKSNHSTDGRTHHEVWKWKDKRDRWVCKVDCMPPA